MQAVKIISTLSIALLTSGCNGKCPEPKIVYVQTKCKVPYVEEPLVDNTVHNNYNDVIAKALKNYVSMKEYSEKLLEAQKVCE